MMTFSEAHGRGGLREAKEKRRKRAQGWRDEVDEDVKRVSGDE